jgi:hypothetical protein
MLVIFDKNFSFLSVWSTTYWTALRFTDLLARTTLRQRVRDHRIWWNLELGNGHELAAWRLTHLPPRVYTNREKRTIELYVVINCFGWFLLTMWSTNVLGRSYVAICRGCTFIYTRTRCSMDWNIPGGPMLEHAGYKRRSKQTRNISLYKHTWTYFPVPYFLWTVHITIQFVWNSEEMRGARNVEGNYFVLSLVFIHAGIFQFGGTQRHSPRIRPVQLWTLQHGPWGTDPSASEQICWSARFMRLMVTIQLLNLLMFFNQEKCHVFGKFLKSKLRNVQS